MIIVYRVAPLTYAIGRHLVQVEHVGICNIIAGERVVPELIQHEAEAGRIAAEATALLTDHRRYAETREKLLGVRAKLGEPGAPGRVAQLALKLLGEKETNV
jgi:lipid-A-disaccharide synthase